MRVGKKVDVVESKRTRSCVVRLEKVRAPFNKGKVIKKSAQSIPLNRSSSSTTKLFLTSPAAQENKRIVGPLKKRPMTQSLMTSQSSSLAKATAILKAANSKASVIETLKTSVASMKPTTAHKLGPASKTSTSRPSTTTKITSTPKLIGTPKSTLAMTPISKSVAAASKLSPTSAKLVQEETPTIAAGRSRRAIKPNPKYASADMITPKMIKNVGALSGSSMSSARDGRKTATVAGSTSSASTAVDKKRKHSTSSSEDFFNKDSSDYDATEDSKDKPYKVFEDSDSDFSDLDIPSRFLTSRARLTKAAEVTPLTASKAARPNTNPTATAGKVSTLKTTNVTLAAKPVASTGIAKTQLSQLRRNMLSANTIANRSPAAASFQAAVANKRKLNESSNESDSDSVAAKRKRLSNANTNSSVTGSLPPPHSSNLFDQKTLMSRKSLPNTQTLNGSKIVSSSNPSRMSTAALLLEKRKALLEKSMGPKAPQMKIIKSTLPTKQLTPNPIAKPLSNTTNNKAGSKAPVFRQRISSPAATKAAAPKVKEAEDKIETSPSEANVEDFETMPTFTIVNINDIINKKGDVLISKASALSKSVSSKTQSKKIEDEDNLNDISDEDEDEEDFITKADSAKKSINKQNQRKNVNSNFERLHTEKESKTSSQRNSAAPSKSKVISPARSNTTNILSKKPAQTILNQNLIDKNINQKQKRGSNVKTSPNKPAPRILNSMVAKKTQPIKPLIANMDDSADESFPLSLEDELDDIDDEDDDLDILSSKIIGKRRTFITSKKPPPGTKENSLAATNRLPSKTTTDKTSSMTLPSLQQRKLTPEKVIISRQGDKIIKKITCFETWYIINMPEDRPSVPVRNQLDIPLIKLANSSKSVELPNSKWNSKVTLYQLSSSALMKSNYATYTGDISEQNISEEDRGKYQPSCVMFRRSVSDRSKSRLPYDRAVIFKNKTFFTNIDGKNVKLIGAPFKISSISEVEILLQLVDELALDNPFVEQTTTVQ